MKRYVLAALILFFALGIAKVAAAQEPTGPGKQDSPAQVSPGKDSSGQASPGRSEAQPAERRSNDTKVDINVQRDRGDQAQRAPQGPEGRPGREGASGAPGPQGPAGAPGPSGGTFLGMDSTVALFVGLAILAVVIVAIVAASNRGGREV